MRADLGQGSRRLYLSSMLLALVAVALVAGSIWPSQLGGRTTWLLPNGTSMEPRISHGDLVVMRTATRYSVGDVVAYHSPDLERVVLHRIVEERGGRFVLQGDNNDFLDPGMVEPRQIIGATWMHLHPGTYLAIGGVLLLVTAGLVLFRRHGGLRSIDVDLDLVSTVAMGTATLAIVGLIALGRMDAAPASPDAGHQLRGSLSYEGRATKSATYPDGTADASEPLFLQLVPTVDFTYEFTPPKGVELSFKDVAFDATVSDENGFTRRMPMSATSVDSGGSHLMRGTLDLQDIRRLVMEVQRETQVTPQDYAVTVAPRIRGRVDGVGFSHQPLFRFGLRGQLLQPPEELTFDERAGGEAGAGNTNRVTLIGMDVEARAARWSLQGLIGLCALAGGLAWALGKARHGSEGRYQQS